MDYKSYSIWLLMILALQFQEGICILRLTMIMEKSEDVFCFSVKNETVSSEVPKIALTLQVNYPQTFAEAGETILEGDDLSNGFHSLYYKHHSTNMTHDLIVRLDGKNEAFTKSEMPRWFSVSTFREVSVLVQGSIEISSCPDSLIPAVLLTTPSSFETKINDEEDNFFLKDETEAFETSTQKARLSEDSEMKAENKTFSPLNQTHNEITNFTSPHFPDIIHSPSLNSTTIGKINSSQHFNSFNHSTENETSRSELSQLCSDEECSTGAIKHDYTVALSLIGVLGAMALIAVVISVVFHRKKKKLIAEARAKPKNRLRQQIYDNQIDEGESQLKLREMENADEEFP